MKSDQQVDAIMQRIPEKWRIRWCGGKSGGCACLGCVQIGNKAVMAEEINGVPFRGDPERLSDAKIRAYPQIYESFKLTKEEWEAWKSRNIKEP